MLKNNFWKTATVMYRISYIILWATWPTLNFTETRWQPENVQFEVNSEIFHKKVPYLNDNYPNLTIRGISPLYITLYFSKKVFKTSLDKSARHFCKLSNFLRVENISVGQSPTSNRHFDLCNWEIWVKIIPSTSKRKRQN